MASSAKIRRDESTTAKIRLGRLNILIRVYFIYLNVYVFGSSSPVELQDTRYCKEKRAKIPRS